MRPPFPLPVALADIIAAVMTALGTTGIVAGVYAAIVVVKSFG